MNFLENHLDFGVFILIEMFRALRFKQEECILVAIMLKEFYLE